jgi:hypothetical protein
MVFIFPVIYILSFILAITDFIRGKKEGFLLFLIFGLSIYTSALSVTFMLGFKDLIIYLQSFKEIFILLMLGTSLWNLKTRLKLHFIDYSILVFFFFTLLYAILPIGEQGLVDRVLAFKSTSFFILVYACGRLFKPEEIYISKYFHYILLVIIMAAVVILYEYITDQHLQTLTGYADYNFYLFNFEPSGNFGLTWTFESEGGFKRFASFFANPLELAAATIIGLSVIGALYTTNENKFKIDGFGILALTATFICILLALSRSSFISYFIVVYFFAFFTRKKFILTLVHSAAALVVLYLIYLFWTSDGRDDGLQQVIINTLNFSNPSSVGHLVEWIQGALAIAENPLGLGLGSSGRIGGSLGENIGGENQFIIIGVQLGIIALLIYLLIYIALIRSCIKWLPRLKGKEKKLCLALLLIKIGFIIPSLTSEIESSSYISYLTWFLSGLFISIITEKGNVIKIGDGRKN